MAKRDKNRLEIELADMKAQFDRTDIEYNRLKEELSKLKRESVDVNLKLSETTKVNERMRSLLDNLEQTKDELLNRLQASNSDKRSGETEKAVLKNDRAAVQRDLMLKDQIITDLKSNIQQLDVALDEAQAELDLKTEELAAIKSQ
jgi:chromosome segregation ATPase